MNQRKKNGSWDFQFFNSTPYDGKRGRKKYLIMVLADSVNISQPYKELNNSTNQKQGKALKTSEQGNRTHMDPNFAIANRKKDILSEKR